MNNLFLYLICAHGILIIGYLTHQYCYQRDHHFLFNRYYFLFLFAFALLLPVLPAPISWSVNETGLQEFYQNTAEGPITSASPTTSITTPGNNTYSTTPNSGTGSAILSGSLGFIQPGRLFLWLYGVGVLVLTFRLSIQFISLWRFLRLYPAHKKGDHYVTYTDQESAAFSFFNRIFLNPEAYSKQQNELIYQHELIHVRQRHFIDILLGEIFTILFWINPLAWRLRFFIRQNLEFLVDQTLLIQGANRKQYQYSLLAVNGSNQVPLPFANYFNQSLLKKRIIMMNKKKSPDNFSIRHLLLIPILAGLALFQIPLTGQQTNEKAANTHLLQASFNEEGPLKGTPIMEGEKVFGIINAHTRLEDLQAMQNEFTRRGVDLQYRNIDFTPEGKLARIQITLTQWNQDTETETLFNNGKAVEGKIIAFFMHKVQDRSAKIGLTREFPSDSFGKDQTDQLLKNTAGVVVIQEKDKDDKVWIKGHLELNK